MFRLNDTGIWTDDNDGRSCILTDVRSRQPFPSCRSKRSESPIASVDGLGPRLWKLCHLTCITSVTFSSAEHYPVYKKTIEVRFRDR